MIKSSEFTEQQMKDFIGCAGNILPAFEKRYDSERYPLADDLNSYVSERYPLVDDLNSYVYDKDYFDTDKKTENALFVINRLVKEIIDYVIAGEDIIGYLSVSDYPGEPEVTLPEDVENILNKIPDERIRNMRRRDIFDIASVSNKIAYLFYARYKKVDVIKRNLILTNSYERVKGFILDLVCEEAAASIMEIKKVLKSFDLIDSNNKGRVFFLKYNAEIKNKDVEHYKIGMLSKAIELSHENYMGEYISKKQCIYECLVYADSFSDGEYYKALKLGISNTFPSCVKISDTEDEIDYESILQKEVDELFDQYCLAF